VRQQPLRQLNKAIDRPAAQRFGGAHLKADQDLARRFRQRGKSDRDEHVRIVGTAPQLPHHIQLALNQMAVAAVADAGQPALHAARFVAVNVFEQVLATGGDGDQHVVRRLRVQDDRQLWPVFSQAPDNAQHVFGLVVPVNHVMKAGAAFDQLPVFMAGDQRDLRAGIAFAQCADGGRIEHQIAEGAGGENHDAFKGLLRIEARCGPEIARDAGIET
jgi:hypothetical protein